MKQPPPKTIVRDDRGQSLVEFALTLPMLLVVMFMITEFGRALYQYNVLVQATREAARAAVVMAESDAPTIGQTRMDNFLDGTGMERIGLEREVVIVPDFNGTGTTVVRATATMPFRWILQGDMPTNADRSGSVAPTGLTLSAETIMRSEAF
ncbi:MAG TPA: TadE/TadG family type IV pilus assembly protein [Acidimicrobiia bacterium]|nr:TadE/TadG family type IV pilus assembly protein [Acidimicrobiia bacterium]